MKFIDDILEKIYLTKNYIKPKYNLEVNDLITQS